MHAYLILAHHQFELLETLIGVLDHKDNDIYIHVDKKAKQFNKSQLEQKAIKSKVTFVDSIHISWGGYSMVKAEFNLLEAAFKGGKYSYYHLISGQDLPLVAQDNIHEFFKRNKGQEFIHFFEEDLKTEMAYRLNRYHLLGNYVGRGGNIYDFFNKVGLKLQKWLKVQRMDLNKVSYRKGSQWFSITEDLVAYLLKERQDIHKSYRYTHCPDEIFLQTVVANSAFKNRLYKVDGLYSNVRLIDWERGNPYVFGDMDIEELMDSKCLFARKFDDIKGPEVVKAIVKKINC